MTTTRQNILATFKEELEELSSLSSVEVYKTFPGDIETVPFPCAFIYSGRESRVMDGRAVIGKETWQWPIFIEVWSITDDLEFLLGEIHNKLFLNETLSGYAITSYRLGVDIFVVDPDKFLQVMVIEYEVLYRHTKGVM